jgi:hypothetical protein
LCSHPQLFREPTPLRSVFMPSITTFSVLCQEWLVSRIQISDVLRPVYGMVGITFNKKYNIIFFIKWLVVCVSILPRRFALHGSFYILHHHIWLVIQLVVSVSLDDTPPLFVRESSYFHMIT